MDPKLLFFLALASVVSLALAKLPLQNGHVYRKIKLAEFGDLNITFAFKDKVGLKPIDSQRILDMHNVLRAKIATGQELHGWDGNIGNPGTMKMPTAANMQAVEWDDRLAKYAQNWANTCKDGHSPLKSNNIKNYELFDLGENLSGDITFLERDMYGEVRWWNFETFSCRSDKQCGHYLNFVAWGMSRIGCGWKVCVDKTTLVCVYAGIQYTAKEEGKRRKPIQHEYLKGPPCSACEQGWDYCMGGGLCATQEMCKSNGNNDCKCLNTKEKCEGNGGMFNPGKCSCKCPPNKMGINCVQACTNTIPRNCGMDCGKSVQEAYFCQKKCGGCGRATSSAFKFWFNTPHKAANSMRLKVRVAFENPDAKSAAIKINSLPDYGKCKNKGKSRTCNILMVRGYCNDALYGKIVKQFCPLSCSWCDEKKAADEKAAKEGTVGLGNIDDLGDLAKLKESDLNNLNSLSKAQIDEFQKLKGLEGIDLSGFKIVP